MCPEHKNIINLPNLLSTVYVPWLVPNNLYVVSHLISTTTPWDKHFLISILHIEKLRHWEVELYAQGHKARRVWAGLLTLSGCPGSKPLYHLCYSWMNGNPSTAPGAPYTHLLEHFSQCIIIWFHFLFLLLDYKVVERITMSSLAASDSPGSAYSEF